MKMTFIPLGITRRWLNKSVSTILKRKCSYLYVTGDKCGEVSNVVQPHLDFDERFKNLESLEKNVFRRGLQIDVKELSKSWDFYKERLMVKEKLFAKKKEIAIEMKKFYEFKDKPKQLESLEFEIETIKEALRKASRTVWEIENNVIIKALQLPNDIDSRVPDEERIERTFNGDINGSIDHLEAGEKLEYLTYINPSCYYLTKDLAKLEMSIADYFETQLKRRNHHPVSNADFSRPVLIEGCVLETKETDQAFLLSQKNDAEKLYLNGGASFLSFYGLHAKNLVNLEGPSFRYVTKGRQYRSNANPHMTGLYSAWQATAVEFFIGTSNDRETSLESDSIFEFLAELYETLGLSFRVVNTPAKNLQPWESLRFNFELFSPKSQKYAEVGNISIINDFISKRLQAYYVDEKKNMDFLHVVCGTVVRVPVLLAVALETMDAGNSVQHLLQKTNEIYAV